MAVFDPAYFRAQGWWRDETLSDWIDRCATGAPDRAAILAADRALTYQTFQADVQSLAAGLADAGVRRGDVVVVHLPNVPEFLIAWLAINALGAVMQTVHTPYGIRELEHLIAHGGGKAAIALARTKDRSPAGDIVSLRERIPTLRLVIAVGGEVPGAINFSALLEQGRGKPPPPRPDANDPFMLLYTSGTTSSPKAVSVTSNHFLSNARMCAAEFGLKPGDRILCLAPYTHLYGLYALELGFAVGATACLLDFFTPAGFVETLKSAKPTVLIAGPAHIAPCLQQRLFAGVDFSALRFAVLSGSTVPASLSAAFEDLLPNGRVVQAWGMTELQFGACSRPSDPRGVRFETIGRATPGTELRVADSEDRPLPSGEIGELHVRGCSLFSGYVRNPDASRAAFTADGWFRTGDLASMDREGNVLLRGRTKELINRGGVKFNPIDMEIAIAGHPAVAQVAIAPVPDEVLGERASCFVVLKSGASLSFEELKAFLSECKFAKFTWPEQLAIVSDMPVTPTRKVMKTELVNRYLKAANSRDSRSAGDMSLPLPLPETRAHIAHIQSERKRNAFALAKTVPWYRDKLAGIDPNALDEPAEWQKIPILDKDTLRKFSHAELLAAFCAVPGDQIAEYWRSGGSTGQPVFYPRTADDLRYGELSWGRSFPCIGIGPGDLCHISFPLGVHPAGQVWARSAKMFGVGMVWVGAGNSYPSIAQLELIQTLRPTVFIGMSSFALHLANLAEAKGIDLAASTVRKLVCSAETLSAAKREKLSRLWGAEVFDVFGMSEAGLMGAENSAHDGIHIWTDMYFIEVVDAETGRPLPEGEVGTLCVTPLWTNHATPFLRWNSGDLVSYVSRSAGSGRFAELFPVIRHANRTTGFFKVRGVNVNHAEFEDMMFRNAHVLDFQAVLETEPKTDLENLRVLIEIKGASEPQAVCAAVAETVKKTFEISPVLQVLERGSLAAEFERSLKAPRFVDRRQ